MQEVQLYIEDIRVDLFKDETISLTSTIKDVRDFSKVFTDFSKSFTLPASKTNNKLFKHYYNSDIDGFDARTKKDANIELNQLPFREGKIKLNGVQLKNNKPYAYSVTFFGNTVNLKDVIGEDKLESLPLQDLDHEFNSLNVLLGLNTSLFSGSIIYPLITHTQRYYYNSDAANHDTGNIAYHPIHVGNTPHGINYFDLKPAMRVLEIINKIESKYTIANGYSQDIVFSDDFFNLTNEQVADLYLWLHKGKGVLGSTTTGELKVSVPDNFAYVSGDLTVTFINDNSEWLATTSTNILYSAHLTITPTETDKNYNISVTDEVSGDILLNLQGVQGVQVNTISLPFSTPSRNWQIKTTLSTEENISLYDANWDIHHVDFSGMIPVDTSAIWEVTNVPFTSTVVVSENMPNMKILDFITGLFKMFNLTAYVSDSEIVVKTLDSFYSVGNTYDITQYVDIKDSKVDNALPYREVKFIYSKPKTFLADAFKDQNNMEFGTLEYSGGEKLDGEKYEIKLPFEHMVYDRLIDANDSVITDAQYGWFVDEKQDKTLGAPLLFYNVNQEIGTKLISYINSGSEIPIGQGQGRTHVNRPSNTNEDAPADYTINFGAEFDEWNASLGLNNNSLFEKFYKTYITDTFNLKNRLTKITAYLPLRILLNYTLADRFIVNGKQYKINSINTNLQNGKSQIELLNDFS